MLTRDRKLFAAMVAVFLAAYYLPLGNPKIQNAILEAFKMLQWYARNHTLACVVPALFIAGAIVTFLKKETVLRHLGPEAKKTEAYAVASVAGTVLAVCSCSVLPMFAGIYRLGAGLGPAATFLYAGPALNVLAIFLTARVLGFQLGVARTVGAVVFGVVVGLLMALIFRRGEQERLAQTMALGEPPAGRRKLGQTAVFLGAMIAFLVFSDWYNPGNVVVTLKDGRKVDAVLLQETRDEIVAQVERPAGAWKVGEKLTLSKREVASIKDRQSWVMDVYHTKWYWAGLMGLLVVLMSRQWLTREEFKEWMENTWDFTKMLVPLLFGGVLAVGFLGQLIPEQQVVAWVGDNSLRANFLASLVGCLFYFATLTEIPILQALMENGMAQGPALSLLLAGPALSIPSILVIRTVLGTAKTLVFTGLVVVMATAAGMMYGAWF